MPAPIFPESTLTLTSLQDPNTPALLDIRPFLARLGRGPEYDAFVQIQQAFDNIQNVFRNDTPSLDQLTIASADIGDLTVGGQFGPGQLTVLNGPPSYSNIGWIGSQDSAIAVNITNVVAGLITTAAPHGLKPTDIVLIAATTNPLHNGYFVVATTPTATTFTATGISGGSTGGTSTKQYQGGWLRTLAVGGTSPADAHFLADVDGSLTITQALITLSGSGGRIVLDPTSGAITVTDFGGGNQVIVQSGKITYQVVDSGGVVILADSSGSLAPGQWQSFNAGLTSEALSRVMDVYGYTGATAFGPLLSLSQFRGTPVAATATQSGDTLGGMIMWGFDGSGESSHVGGVKALANEVHTGSNHGADVIIEATAAGGSTTPVEVLRAKAARVDITGDTNTTGVFRKGGTAGISVAITTAKLTGGGANGSMTFSGGILTSQTAAT